VDGGPTLKRHGGFAISDVWQCFEKITSIFFALIVLSVKMQHKS